MQRTIKLETHFLAPPYKIVDEIKAYGDQQNRSTNVKADHTHWHVHQDNKFNILNLGLTELDLRNSRQILGKINIDKDLIYEKKNS